MAAKSFYLFFILFCLMGCHYSLDGAQTTNVKAVVFDFGGVIIKTDRNAVASFIAKSLDIGQQEALQSLEELKEISKSGGIEQNFWINYTKVRGKTVPKDWLAQLNQVRFDSIKEIPGMVDLVSCLKAQGIQTALLSNVRESQAQIKRKLGLYDLFQPAILSYEAGLRKPDPKAYKLLLEQLNLPPQAVIFVDNKPDNIAAAKAMGIDAILFENAEQLIKALITRGIIIHPVSQKKAQPGS